MNSLRRSEESSEAGGVSPAGGGQPQGSLSNLQARLITGFIAAAFTLGIAYYGGLPFQLFSIGVGAVLLYEWNGIIADLRLKSAPVAAWVCFMIIGLALPAGASAACIYILLLAGFGVSFAAAWREKGGRAALWQGAGFIYACLFPIGFVFLRSGLGKGESFGLYWVFFLYVSVWASDVGAYIFGRSFGGAKLAPKISPNKTWSGAAGGLICAAAAALCFSFLSGADSGGAVAGGAAAASFYPSASFALTIAAACLLSLVAQIGDLGESWFKRLFNVKDSSGLLPGHGGIMDRVDGLLPACIVFVWLAGVFG